MEENKSIFNDLQVDFMGSQQLTETSRWAKFFGIVCLSLAGILLLFVLLSWNKLKTSINELSNNGGQVLITLFIILIAIAVVAIILIYFLVRGMSRIKRSLRTKEQTLFNDGLGDLKTYFTIYGIVALILLLVKIYNFFYK